MNALHYSFSLSACPKCHLLICNHTSLANLDFNIEQQEETQTDASTENPLHTTSHGINLYIFPSTMMDNRYSWTSFGTECEESTNTIRHLSSNNGTICENIPFANETILHSTLLLTPTINQIVRTQSERLNQSDSSQPMSQTKSLSFSAIYKKSSAFPSIEQSTHSTTLSHSSSTRSFHTILLLILTFLITNTIDIVLIYIYYHTNYIYLISFSSTIIICDMILWINDLIQSKTIPSYLLLIPFHRRFYLLYKLLEFLMIIFEKHKDQQIFHPLLKIKEQNLFQHLTVFYLIHTAVFSFVNLYFWSNRFQLSTELFLNMDIYIPQWISRVDTTVTTPSILPTWQISNAVPYASVFVLMSISYYLLINYSLLSTFLSVKQYSLISVLSKFCLIIPRLYAFIFLFHFNAYWLSITFLLVHFILMLAMTFDRKKFQQNDNRIFLQMIFSFMTHQSIDELSINAMVLLENISIFLHRLYLEVVSFDRSETTLRLIIFISVLISFQIFGFICHILSKYLLRRRKTIAKL